MPHINSIRLVNVHFNNSTQFYDDFKMNFEGKNATYDLENGGGKSLLLLMILQTVLPKTYLRREKPVSLIFQGGRDRTSHVVVEWILEEGSNYKYLLTGFCARKRKGSNEAVSSETSEEEQNVQSGDIEHLNWCVFYNDNKITGMKYAPLVKEEAGRKIYAGFEDVRKYIQQMKQKGLPAEVFDGIEKYQSYISAQNIITAEWNIIRGINSGENNIESYFRQNASSRKLIENQFIKIIEDVEALNKGEKNNEESLLLADTLIEIRSRLNEYLRLKGHMTEFEKIKDYYNEFGRKNDELLIAFQEHEAYKVQAAGIRNLIGERLKILIKDKNEGVKKIEFNTASSKEGTNLKKLLEAGFVNYGKQKLVLEKQQSDAEKDSLENKYRELEQRYCQARTLEGYGDYRNTMSKLNETKQRIEILETDGDELSNSYRAAGGKLKFLVFKYLKELKASLEKKSEAKNALENDKKQNQDLLIAEEKKSSLSEAKISNMYESEKSLSEKLKLLNNFFLSCGEMEAVIGPERFLEQLENQLSRYLEESVANTERIRTIDASMQSLGLENADIAGEIKTKDQIKKRDESYTKAYQDEQSELLRRASSYGKNDLQDYKNTLELILHKEGLNKLEKEIESGRLRQKKQLSEERGYYVPNEEILSLAEQLSAKCNHVEVGIDWIAKSQPEEKVILLRELPFLPFSVIIDRESFEKLKNDKLKVEFSSDYPVPVVNLETVRAMKNGAKDEIYYLCGFSGLIIESNRYEQYIESMDATLNNSKIDIASAEVRISELNKEMLKVAAFFERYPKELVDGATDRVKEIEKDISALQNRLVHISEEKNKITNEKECVKKKLEDLSKQIAECQDKSKKLNDILDIGKELSIMRENLAMAQKELAQIKNTIVNVRVEKESIEQQHTFAQEQIVDLKLQIHDMEKDNDQLLSFEEICNNTPIAQVRSEYKALQQAVSGKTAEESELRSRMEEYRSRLDNLRERILQDYGGNLEQIEKSEEGSAQIIIPSREYINNLKQNKEKLADDLKAIIAKISAVYAKITNAEGKYGEIIKDLPEVSETDLPDYDSELRYKQEIEYTLQLIKSYDEETNTLNEELEKMKDNISRLNNQAEDYDLFIEREAVINNGSIATEVEEFRMFESKYRQIKSAIEIQQSKWNERLKIINDETTAFVIREPLDELAKISLPGSALQCLSRNEAFKEYVMNIEEQMQKISNDIVQLESYQLDFVRRCIQRAELVLGHLRKVEALSRIEVYGRRTNMIELKLQEFEEKEKQLRMKAHIDGIVREISEEGIIDRKYVANKLSTKELIAQITDMDKAAVRLYKIESIPENSRLYRWENAIGSEGQNNSLYFIFAACLISFIRMLSIANTSVKTKKVIIADNPFGATSAVYLWDPMFKIMKQNDIQLIAPGHRIPREITSRFGVSYLLNQDILQDGRMRVVVKDVRVEEDDDKLRYVEPEQLSLF